MTAMDSNSTAGLLPGQDAPLAVVTATDQTGIIIITTAFAMVFALVSICIRIFIRMEFHHAFSVDDHFSIASMVSFVILLPILTRKEKPLRGTIRIHVVLNYLRDYSH